LLYLLQDDGIDFSILDGKGKGKEIDTGLEFKSHSPQELQNLIDDDIRELATVTGLKVIKRYHKSDSDSQVT
jgi:hypothetical protein